MGVKFCGLFDTWRLFFLHTRDFGSFLFLGAEKWWCKWHNFWQKISNSFRSCFYEVNLR